ncbi:MAG: DNA-binding response regulator [Omnitrophica bacterium RIFCSPLOWO2_12_FULL_50_11]|nr:MAG: DNA-binding response regulator [Omnitrophica bacterium RIFCSPLOWO2_12_FULL_50_11]
MAQEKILIIEDEKNILELVKYNLEREGYRVSTAASGDLGLEKARREKPALLILDLMLPELGGLEICKILKNNEDTCHIPIIMLTAKGEEIDKVLGLELGADDYVTKPFSPKELIARVKAVLRRREEKPLGTLLKSGTLELDLDKYMIRVKSKPVHLTSKEYELLRTLIQARGRVLSREHLLDQVWGYDPSFNIETRTVDMHIGQLRKKIKSEGHRIVTVKNAGYRFDLDA